MPEFKRFNVLYGWNWSGKTTLSRIFQCFECGDFDKDYPDAQFELELDDGVKLDQRNLANVLNIRVFNKLFIEENISWEGSAQPIYFIGQENIKLEKDITELKAKRKETADDIIKLKDKLQRKYNDNERLFKTTAKNIKDNLTTNLNDHYRFYDKGNLNTFIQKNEVKLRDTRQLILKEDKFKNYKQSITKESRDKLNEVPVTRLNPETLITRANKILSRSITASSIKKLMDDPEINNWVKEGLDIHKKRESLLICEFCGHTLPEGLITRLEDHFSDEYNQLLKNIDGLFLQITDTKIKLNLQDSSRLYLDFQKDYAETRTVTENAVEVANKELDKIIGKLTIKKQNPFQEYEINDKEIKAERFDQLYESVQALNRHIASHNTLTDNFAAEIGKAKEKLELHFAAEVFGEYREFQEVINSLEEAITKRNGEIKQYDKDIDKKEKDLLDHRIPADNINDLLKKYFGREEIKLEVAGDGYHLKRNAEIATNLSEGEKTAIAFSYFITKLRERDFDLCNGIVMIDDPVSSLDSNALYQAFAFMKNSCKEASQLFVLTHNYDLFRQVKNWFYYTRKGNYYMITNHLNENGVRIARISKIDKLLYDYDSEYHYLFSLLYRYAKLDEHDLERVYHLPNIARKFIECFLAFKIPAKKSLYKKLESLDYDKDKQTKIYRFIQTHSHLSNEDGISNFDMSMLSETPQVVNDILGLIENEDKRHYDLLCDSLT